jgi:DNA-binding CsgD family transcriptional regulator
VLVVSDRVGAVAIVGACARQQLTVEYIDTPDDARDLIARSPARYVAAFLQHELLRDAAHDLVELLLSEDNACYSLCGGDDLGPRAISTLRRCGAVRVIDRRDEDALVDAALRETVVETLRYRGTLRVGREPARSNAAAREADVAFSEWLELDCAATKKELEVARLVRDGKSNDEMAWTLRLSLAAVRQRLERLQGRCFVESKSELEKLLSGVFPRRSAELAASRGREPPLRYGARPSPKTSLPRR